MTNKGTIKMLVAEKKRGCKGSNELSLLFELEKGDQRNVIGNMYYKCRFKETIFSFCFHG